MKYLLYDTIAIQKKEDSSGNYCQKYRLYRNLSGNYKKNINMKKILFKTLFCLIWCSTYGQIDTVIYGLARNSSPAEVYFAKINPASGKVTNISSHPLATSLDGHGITIDPFNKIYYFISYGKFIGVDMLTGNIISNPTISNTKGFLFDGFIFNCADSIIYGISGDIYFAKIDPASGLVTNISASALGGSFDAFSSTIDPINQIYYFVSNGKFVGVDIKTGNMVSNPIITNSDGIYFNGFMYNYIDSTIYGFARKTPPGGIFLAKIDPSSGVVTNISPSSMTGSVDGMSITIDPINNVYYFVGFDVFKGVDLKTGNVISSATISNSNGKYFDGFRYGTNCYPLPPQLVEEKKEHLNTFLIYPNPAIDEIKIKSLSSRKYRIEMFNSFGQKVFFNNYREINSFSLNISEFKKGIYFIRLTDSEGISNGEVLQIE